MIVGHTVLSLCYRIISLKKRFKKIKQNELFIPLHWTFSLSLSFFLSLSLYMYVYTLCPLYANHIIFKTGSGARRLNTRREGLNDKCLPGRFPYLPSCWAPCNPCASIEVMVSSTQEVRRRCIPLLPLIGRALDCRSFKFKRLWYCMVYICMYINLFIYI